MSTGTFDHTPTHEVVFQQRIEAQVYKLLTLGRLTVSELFEGECPDEGHARILDAFKEENVNDLLQANIKLTTPSGNFFALCEIGPTGRRLYMLFWAYKLAQAEA